MIALIQRVLEASVRVDGELVGAIGPGLPALVDTGGGLLLVSQFTLAADTRSGMRPSFTSAASPEEGRRGFDRLVELCRARHPHLETGRFGAHMLVSLANDGPVTFRLQS